MTFDTFKTLFHKFPKTLTQIAFGIMNISTNPDFFKMMYYARECGVIPKYTCHGFDVTDENAEQTAKLCGAVAVSVYSTEHSYNAIKKFTDAGMTQVNMHFMLAAETYEKAFKVVSDIATDSRLAKMNAIVFLAYKPKGRNAGEFTSVPLDKYTALLKHCDQLGVSYGMDSCSAPRVYKVFENTDRYTQIAICVEACEASLMSSYCNVYGAYFPCSFTEESHPDWMEGLDVVNCNSFVTDIWNHPKTVAFRNKLLSSTNKCSGCPSQSACHACPVFDITPCCKQQIKYLKGERYEFSNCTTERSEEGYGSW